MVNPNCRASESEATAVETAHRYRVWPDAKSHVACVSHAMEGEGCSRRAAADASRTEERKQMWRYANHSAVWHSDSPQIWNVLTDCAVLPHSGGPNLSSGQAFLQSEFAMGKRWQSMASRILSGSEVPFSEEKRWIRGLARNLRFPAADRRDDFQRFGAMLAADIQMGDEADQRRAYSIGQNIMARELAGEFG